MAGINLRKTLDANEEFDFVAGTEYEFPQGPNGSIVTVAAVLNAVAIGAADLTVQFGGRIRLSNASLSLTAATTTGPTWRDNTLIRDLAVRGEKIMVKTKELAGLATTIVWAMVEFQPV